MCAIEVKRARDFFLDGLAKSGSLSIRDCKEGLSRNAGYEFDPANDRDNWGRSMEFLIATLLSYGPVIEPDQPSGEQARVWSQWKMGNRSDWGAANEAVFDGIRWKLRDSWKTRVVEIHLPDYFDD
jgi:hypothetical protein